MSKYNNILAFIDVDNCAMTEDSYTNVMSQIAELGEVTSAKIYGVNQKKHRDIIDNATDNGYEVAMPVRIKKRGAKVLDTRILVDVITSMYTTPSVDAVAIVCAPSDLVYLYRELKKCDVDILALDNGDDANNALIDEVLDLGIVELIKLPKPKKPVTAKPVVVTEPTPVVEPAVVAEPVVVAEPTPVVVVEPVTPVVVEPVVVDEPVEVIDSAVQEVLDELSEDNGSQTPVTEQPATEQPAESEQVVALSETELLLQEIQRLRQENNAMQQQVEQVETQSATLVDEAESLLDLVQELRNDDVEQEDVSAEPVEVTPVAPVEVPVVEVTDSASIMSPDNKDDGDLLRRIQAIRASSSGDDDELVARLKKLLLEESL